MVSNMTTTADIATAPEAATSLRNPEMRNPEMRNPEMNEPEMNNHRTLEPIPKEFVKPRSDSLVARAATTARVVGSDAAKALLPRWMRYPTPSLSEQEFANRSRIRIELTTDS